MSKGPANPERSFGVSVGAVLCGIALLLVWRGRISRAEWVGGVGAVLLVLGLVRPSLLKWPSAAWWRFAKALGYVNAPVLLTVLVGLVLTPLGLIWRLTGKDPLMRRRSQWSGWSEYPERYRDPRHYERMFLCRPTVLPATGRQRRRARWPAVGGSPSRWRRSRWRFWCRAPC